VTNTGKPSLAASFSKRIKPASATVSQISQALSVTWKSQFLNMRRLTGIHYRLFKISAGGCTMFEGAPVVRWHISPRPNARRGG
jgi:hypothetical protein